MNEVIWGIIAGTLLILLLIAGIFITFFISNRQRVKQERLLAETKMTFEKEIRNVETEVQEQLMSSIANELHDNAGQLLTAMHIEIHNQNSDFPEYAKNYKQVENYLEEVIQILRLLGKSLNTDFINDSGLVAAIEVEAERINSLRRFKIHLNLGPNVSSLEKTQELILFRIFQEIIQNALKHSKAKNLYVHLNFAPFEFKIEDDGKGFDYAQIVDSNKASGLRNINKRANLAKLTSNIESEVGSGTKFSFSKQIEIKEKV